MEGKFDDDLIHQEWFQLMCNVIREVLPQLNVLEEQKGYIGSYFDFPSLSQLSTSGFPSIYKSSFRSPINYGSAITLGKGNVKSETKNLDKIYLEDLASYKTLLEYSESNPAILDYFEREESSEGTAKGLLEYGLYSIITDLVDRYKHQKESANFEPSALKPIYKQLETGLFANELPIDIVVPIILTKFEMDTITIDERIELKKMSDSFQLSRAQNSDSIVNSNILYAATHALVLKDFTIKNSTKFVEDVRGIRWDYHFKEVDNFLAAIRVATNINTGYAQTIFRPVGWAKGYTADLEYLVFGPTLRKFPSTFENNYWHSTVDPLNSDQLSEIKELYIRISQTSNNRIDIAVKRLNSCYLRDEEEDSILDVMIALETLLLQGDKEGVTYKLAIRLAALLAITEQKEYLPLDVFNSVKKLYSYRSAIVHRNSKDAHKRREVQFKNGATFTAPALALQYLRLTLRAVLIHPNYLDPEEIDKAFLSKQLHV